MNRHIKSSLTNQERKKLNVIFFFNAMRHSAVQDAIICLSIQYSYYLKQMKYLSCISTRITLRCLSFGIEYC